MARSPNPYQVSSGPYQGIGEGLANLGQLFVGGADPMREAQATQAAWQGREARENVTDLVDARTGREGLGSLLAEFDPAGDNRQMFAQGVGSGAMNVDDLASLFLTMQSNFGGSDPQVGRAYVGAGNTIGTGDGFSLDDREGIAQREQDYAIAQQQAADAGALQRTLAQQAGMDRRDAAARSAAGGTGGTGGAEGPDNVGPLFDPMDANRISDLEGDADEALNNLASDMGLDVSAIPPDLRTWMLSSAVQGMQQGDYQSPRAAVGSLWQQAVQGTDEGGLFSDSSIDYEIPAAMSPAAAQPQTQDSTLMDAASAIERGADPGAVRERLQQMGYTDQQISQAGL